MLAKVFDAPTAWNYLNGIVNIYKPAGVKVNHVRNSILVNLCKDLNKLQVREPSQRVTIEAVGNGSHNYEIQTVSNLADDILSVGQRYQLEDMKCGVAAGLGIHTSGVLVVGLNKGLTTTTKLQLNRPVRVYHVSGRFGKSTENHFEDSRVTLKASARHVQSERFGSMIASLQASHQRKMFENCGVDLQSQAAYEIATKGLIRPVNNTMPVIYGMKLIDFRNPEFTLEILAINETEEYLAAIINDIAIEQKTVAFCSGIRCIRHGHFSIEDSLLRRHWTLEGILNNMAVCRRLLEKHPTMLRRTTPELSFD